MKCLPGQMVVLPAQGPGTQKSPAKVQVQARSCTRPAPAALLLITLSPVSFSFPVGGRRLARIVQRFAQIAGPHAESSTSLGGLRSLTRQLEIALLAAASLVGDPRQHRAAL